MRKSLFFTLTSPVQFKSQLLQWASQFSTLAFLNSNTNGSENSSTVNYNTYDLIVGVDAINELKCSYEGAFKQLKNFIDRINDWCFGYLSYDLKNDVEKIIYSKNHDSLEFPDLHFFQPRLVFILRGNRLELSFIDNNYTENQLQKLIEEIYSIDVSNDLITNNATEIQAQVSEENYFTNVAAIKHHIQQGDIYELNYCIEFVAQQHKLQPHLLYEQLNRISQTPMSCYYKTDFVHLCCASPERFLKKIGSKLISQPIKGTRKKGNTEVENNQLKNELFNDAKERSENVMIVDLVRNDLSRSASKGSVKVEELFGVYSFQQVHQLISTVSCELSPEIHFIDALSNAFPMGSMTGAPKVKAMQLIELFENSKRGAYSGAVGYITPEKDFDFNVVIRSILHNSKTNTSSFMVGSAITANSIAQNEYDECFVKAAALFQVIEKKQKN
jgi:para-aminobenzoate synthetase component 1